MSSSSIFIGTYTSNSKSQGIYHASLDEATGELSPAELAVEASNPSFLATHPSKQVLYAVQESGDGKLCAYARDGRQLRELAARAVKGNGPCHLGVSIDGSHLYVATYGGGTLERWSLDARGLPSETAQVFQNDGQGPDTRRQQGPHMHWVGCSGSFVYACDLGTDEVLAFRDSDELFAPMGDGRAKAPSGAGPRHGAFHPQGRFLYVNNEMACTVSVFEQAPHGALRLIQTVAAMDTVPAGSSGAEIAIDPAGRWLYVSNRGVDSITCFEITGEGSLERRREQKLSVKTPRSFALSPSGSWLVAAGQASNDLQVMRVNRESGELVPVGPRVSVPSPVCVLFAN